jgi:hypothetical protein
VATEEGFAGGRDVPTANPRWWLGDRFGTTRALVSALPWMSRLSRCTLLKNKRFRSSGVSLPAIKSDWSAIKPAQ